ncbi:MAG: glycosyltransferase family 2 protein [Janthinobacterium lividum]
MTDLDSVAVIIPTFNAQAFMIRAIKSVQAQTRPASEIIIVDDCSTDDTRAILDRIAGEDPRIRIVHMPRNGGPSAARNAGIKLATSRWIAILDADDAFAPQRLAELVPFAVDTNADIATDNLALYDAQAKLVTGTGLADGVVVPDCPIGLRDFLDHNRADGKSFDWGLLKPLFRRQVLVDRAVFYNPEVRHGEDFQLAVELLLAGATFRILNRPLYLYTQRQGAVSGRASGMTRTTVAYGTMRDAALKMSRDERLTSDPELVELLRIRAHGLGRLDDADFVSRAVHGGQIGRIVQRCMRDPAFFPRMLRQIGAALRRRLPF